MKPPGSYCTLLEALKTNGEFINIIGVVTDYMSPTSTAGEDLMCTFSLQDADFLTSSYHRVGLRVRYFGRGLEFLPNVKSVGDVVVLGNVKVKEYKSEPIVLSNRSSSSLTIHHESIPKFTSSTDFSTGKTLPFCATRRTSPLSIHEQAYVIHLNETLKSNNSVGSGGAQDLPGQPVPIPDGSTSKHTRPRGSKFSQIKDIKPQTFYDLVGEVVKAFPLAYGDVELYITDYTANSLLTHHEAPDGIRDSESRGRDGDDYGYTYRQKQNWKGPYGRLTLKIELRSPHANYAQSNVNEGDFVALQNVRIKTDSRGNLEGNIFPDNLAPNRVNVQKISGNKDERVGSIKLRKEEYVKSFGATSMSKPLVEKSKKRKKKDQQKQDRKTAEAAFDDHDDNLSIVPRLLNERNKNVQCTNRSVKLTSVVEIVIGPHLYDKTPLGIERKLPFINAKYRSQVRVVDFYPQTLEDFARRSDDLGHTDVEQSGSEDADFVETNGRNEEKWKWAFYLLVEDGKQANVANQPSQLNLLVGGSDADYLLKLDATDLRKDERTLSKLREKLFLLWGDLEEIKAKETAQLGAVQPVGTEGQRSGFACSSRSFECCIMEYGVPVKHDGKWTGETAQQWRRMHKMFETTIMD